MHPLDNVIWNALTTRQSHFAEGNDSARKFVPEVSPLAGLRETGSEAYDSLAALLGSGATAGIFLDDPFQARPGWSYVAGAPLVQMVFEDGLRVDDSRSAAEIVELGEPDSPEMIALAARTKPGPFSSRTRELGRYFGIRQEGKLVAMAGERLKVPGYTEVSAVCTHPDHTGKGYAAELMAIVMRGIRQRAETPFLHAREDNTRAIALYERLGFRKRKVGHFAVLRRS